MNIVISSIYSWLVQIQLQISLFIIVISPVVWEGPKCYFGRYY